MLVSGLVSFRTGNCVSDMIALLVRAGPECPTREE
jgi:hypothetical protein